MWCLNLRENTLHHGEQRNCLVFVRWDAGERGEKKLKFKLKIILPNWCYHLQRGLKWIYLYSRIYSANCILNSSSSRFLFENSLNSLFFSNENCCRIVSRICWWTKRERIRNKFTKCLKASFYFESFEIDEIFIYKDKEEERTILEKIIHHYCCSSNLGFDYCVKNP